MTDDDFRRMALGMKDVIESAHMGHPDFRVQNRIFATLHADLKYGMVNLTPEQQARFIADAPDAFKPESGAWGVQGATAVRLDRVDEEMLGEAMTLAWRNRVEKSASASKRSRTPGRRTTSPAKTRRGRKG